VCGKCERRFADLSTLKDHKIIHTGKFPYQCEMCDYSTTRQHNLTRHIMQKHTAAEDKPFKEKHFKCEVCEKLFSKARKFNQHSRTNMDECDECPKTFAKGGSLNSQSNVEVRSGELSFFTQRRKWMESKESTTEYPKMTYEHGHLRRKLIGRLLQRSHPKMW
jgi:KRAB domain-containing zinc finger protein